MRIGKKKEKKKKKGNGSWRQVAEAKNTRGKRKVNSCSCYIRKKGKRQEEVVDGVKIARSFNPARELEGSMERNTSEDKTRTPISGSTGSDEDPYQNRNKL